MIEIHENKNHNPKIIKMGKMKPLQIAKVIEGSYDGRIVMRTSHLNNFEVMDLSYPRPDGCWDHESVDINVELLDYPLTITISND